MDHSETEISLEEEKLVKKHYRELQKLLERHIGEVPGLDPKWMAHLLDFDEVHLIPNIWDIKHVNHLLDYLEGTAANIDFILYEGLPSMVSDSINFAGMNNLHAAIGKKITQVTSDEHKRMLDENVHNQVAEALTTLADNPDVLNSIVNEARATAEMGIPLGRKDIDAWRLVAAAAKLCEVRYPGVISVPKYMNEAGPFYRLLVDLFVHYELESSPVAAFKAWRSHVEITGQKY